MVCGAPPHVHVCTLLSTILISTTMGQPSSWNPARARTIQKSVCTNQPERALAVLNLTGTFPTWLQGSYFRNGPGDFDVTDGKKYQQVNSVFDGYAQITKFDIDGARQQVTHMSKFVRTGRRITLEERKDMSYQGKIMFGTTPGRQEDRFNVFNLGGEVSVNMLRVGGESQHLLAVGELPYGQEINSSTLETIMGSDRKGKKL